SAQIPLREPSWGGSTAPYSPSGGSGGGSSLAVVTRAATAPEGPRGLAATPPTARPGTRSGANGMGRLNGAVSAAAATSLAASTRPAATGPTSLAEGQDPFSLGDSELLDEVAVGLIGARGDGTKEAAADRSQART